jgi:hypothetical protein
MNIWPISQFADKTEFNAWFTNVAIHHANWIKYQTHVNKGNATAVSHVSKEPFKACLLPKETRYFICEYRKTKTVKKQPTCQYQKAYLLVKHLNQIK